MVSHPEIIVIDDSEDEEEDQQELNVSQCVEDFICLSSSMLCVYQKPNDILDKIGFTVENRGDISHMPEWFYFIPPLKWKNDSYKMFVAIVFVIKEKNCKLGTPVSKFAEALVNIFNEERSGDLVSKYLEDFGIETILLDKSISKFPEWVIRLFRFLENQEKQTTQILGNPNFSVEIPSSNSTDSDYTTLLLLEQEEEKESKKRKAESELKNEKKKIRKKNQKISKPKAAAKKAVPKKRGKKTKKRKNWTKKSPKKKKIIKPNKPPNNKSNRVYYSDNKCWTCGRFYRGGRTWVICSGCKKVRICSICWPEVRLRQKFQKHEQFHEIKKEKNRINKEKRKQNRINKNQKNIDQNNNNQDLNQNQNQNENIT